MFERGITHALIWLLEWNYNHLLFMLCSCRSSYDFFQRLICLLTYSGNLQGSMRGLKDFFVLFFNHHIRLYIKWYPPSQLSLHNPVPFHICPLLPPLYLHESAPILTHPLLPRTPASPYTRTSPYPRTSNFHRTKGLASPWCQKRPSSATYVSGAKVKCFQVIFIHAKTSSSPLSIYCILVSSSFLHL